MFPHLLFNNGFIHNAIVFSTTLAQPRSLAETLPRLVPTIVLDRLYEASLRGHHLRPEVTRLAQLGQAQAMATPSVPLQARLRVPSRDPPTQFRPMENSESNASLRTMHRMDRSVRTRTPIGMGTISEKTGPPLRRRGRFSVP